MKIITTIHGYPICTISDPADKDYGKFGYIIYDAKYSYDVALFPPDLFRTRFIQKEKVKNFNFYLDNYYNLSYNIIIS